MKLLVRLGGGFPLPLSLSRCRPLRRSPLLPDALSRPVGLFLLGQGLLLLAHRLLCQLVLLVRFLQGLTSFLFLRLCSLELGGLAGCNLPLGVDRALHVMQPPECQLGLELRLREKEMDAQSDCEESVLAGSMQCAAYQWQ